jgi:phage terminase large subunit-like protein
MASSAATLDELEPETEERSLGPQAGPQMAFAECDADVAFFGGSAGGGKSWVLLYDGVKWVVDPEVRRYRGLLLRRTAPELLGGGGLWDESQGMYSDFGGRMRGGSSLDWTFDAASGRIRDRHRIEFRHLQHETSVRQHLGRQYAFIGFDEVTHFSERQFWYMVSRLRSSSGVRPYVRGTCNPDPDSFVAELIDWWIGDDGYPILERSGVLRWLVRVDDAIEWFDSREAALEAHPAAAPMSFTFIASRLKDNKILTDSDPTYRAKLMSMARVDRMRLLGDEERGGNWRVRETAGMFFAREKIHIVDRAPSPVVATVRFWDKAHTAPTPKHPDPDWTRGARISRCENGEVYIDDLVSARDKPGEIFALMREVAVSDGVECVVGGWCETGFAGKTDSTTTQAVLEGFVVQMVDSHSADTSAEGFTGSRSSRAKRAFARSWVPLVEDGRLYVKRAPWTEIMLAELHAFPDGKKDDIVDSISGGTQLLAVDPGTTLAEAMAGVK